MIITVEGGEIEISLEGRILERSSEQEAVETFRVYEKYLTQVLSKDNEKKKIIIDWQKLEDIVENAHHRHRRAIRQYVHAVLLSLGLLVRSPRGSYSFSDERMNPIWGMP